MRMWLVWPKILCRKHLLGIHNELHKYRPSFIKHHSISGRIFPVVQIEPESMKSYHDEIAEEMISRGYNHNTPYFQPDLSYLSNKERFSKVDVGVSFRDLFDRCPECKKRYLNL